MKDFEAIFKSLTSLLVWNILGFGFFLGNLEISFAGDKGFRYKDGLCQNAKGRAGLNTSYFGQCSLLDGAVLGSLDLSNLDFSGSSMQNTDFQGSKLNGSIFIDVNLEGANFSGVQASEAQFVRAKLSGARFSKAFMGGAIFTECQAQGVNFSGAKMQYSVFESCALTKALFLGTDLSDTKLKKSLFSSSNFTSAQFVRSLWRHIQIDKADFTGANFLEGSFFKVTGVNVGFKDISARKIKIKDSNFKSADFSKGRLDAAEFLNTSFSESIFLKAVLSGLKASNVNFEKTSLRGADFSGATFKKTILRDAVFSKNTKLPFDMDTALAMGMLFKGIDCQDSTEVDYDEVCYYLDGSGGRCEEDYTLAPQSILTEIAPLFMGKNYRTSSSNNCCIWHRDIDEEGQDWGINGNECNGPSPMSTGPELSGGDCSDANNRADQQLTLCQTIE